MGLTVLGFAASGTRWASDDFTPSSPNVAVGVKFLERPGSAVVERSIDGVNRVVAGVMAGGSNDSMYVLMNVCGFVVGETLRVVVTEEPESMHFLEE